MLAGHRDRARRGQALAEFALVLPILALLLVMAVDFGRVFFGWVSINNAARVGASYAAANADAWGTPGDATRRSRYAELVQNDLQDLNCVLPGVPSPSFDDADGNGEHDTGESVEVELECAFSLLTPLGSAIVGSVDLGGTATFPVHYTIRTSLPPPPPPPPAPTCPVPDTVGQSRNAARALWTGASFQLGNLIETGTGNFTVASQTVASGTELPCATGSMEIIEGGGPPPPPPPPACCPPTANFTADKTRGKTPLTVQFDDRSTTPAGCPILSWSWTFGNGSSTLQDPSQIFTYVAPGGDTKYTISLTVTNAGGSDTETKNNYVRVDP